MVRPTMPHFLLQSRTEESRFGVRGSHSFDCSSRWGLSSGFWIITWGEVRGAAGFARKAGDALRSTIVGTFAERADHRACMGS